MSNCLSSIHSIRFCVSMIVAMAITCTNSLCCCTHAQRLDQNNQLDWKVVLEDVLETNSQQTTSLKPNSTIDNSVSSNRWLVYLSKIRISCSLNGKFLIAFLAALWKKGSVAAKQKPSQTIKVYSSKTDFIKLNETKKKRNCKPKKRHFANNSLELVGL